MSDNVTSDEEIAQFAAQLNHPHLERQIAAAEDISLLLGGDRPDEALLGGIIHHKGALKGLLRLLHAGNDETWEIAFNVLFMLSMSEPERPFACPAHSANRTLIGEVPGIFEAFVTGCFEFARLHSCMCQCCCTIACTARESSAPFLYACKCLLAPKICLS